MDKRINIQTTEELAFTIFCIENVAQDLDISSDQIYKTFKENNIINGYIVPFYDILHTQGKTYIVNDLKEYMQNRGVII